MALSRAARAHVQRVAPDGAMLELLEFTHPLLVEPLRLVNNPVDVDIPVPAPGGFTTVHFYACAFELTWPDDVDQQVPRGQLTVDNIGRELTQVFEETNGAFGAKCRVLVSRPDVLEFAPWQFGDYATGYFGGDYVESEDAEGYVPFELDMTLDLSAVVIDSRKVTCTLGFQSTLDKPAVAIRYDPTTAPGIF